ncbi:hypothetical protein OC498_06145 [Acinetobacter bohemicus]|uniref:hypothetical protein n=1 Tax=Acinetobacter TaxID=469 RepID=UPI00209B225F|nr:MULTISPECIES: hypothetical protein [Acinetobacter]MCO8042237.1 hypothetical protein [Acinetobacter sp. S4400-12]MCO8045303.1 hypothetical protein [Acinetobacter sp. S4397-1]MCU7224487.1 hypothetical protein [Acinetobacter bohemicus]
MSSIFRPDTLLISLNGWHQQQDGKNPAEKSLGDFLSSHPATAERIQAVKAFEQEHAQLTP